MSTRRSRNPKETGDSAVNWLVAEVAATGNGQRNDRVVQILAVDDSAAMRRMVKAILARDGFDVGIADNANLALEMAQAEPYQLVLADMHMPGMDGAGLIERLRGMPHYRRTPILVVTTDGSEENRVRAREAGANGWIIKPFSPDQLLNVVNQVLGLNRTGASDERSHA